MEVWGGGGCLSWALNLAIVPGRRPTTLAESNGGIPNPDVVGQKSKVQKVARSKQTVLLGSRKAMGRGGKNNLAAVKKDKIKRMFVEPTHCRYKLKYRGPCKA